MLCTYRIDRNVAYLVAELLESVVVESQTPALAEKAVQISNAALVVLEHEFVQILVVQAVQFDEIVAWNFLHF